MSIQTEMSRISQNVANTYAALEAMGCEMPTEQNSDNLAPTAGTSKVVRYDAQNLTDAQKEQVRKNTGSASAKEVSKLSETIADYKASGIIIVQDGNTLTINSGGDV